MLELPPPRKVLHLRSFFPPKKKNSKKKDHLQRKGTCSLFLEPIQGLVFQLPTIYNLFSLKSHLPVVLRVCPRQTFHRPNLTHGPVPYPPGKMPYCGWQPDIPFPTTTVWMVLTTRSLIMVDFNYLSPQLVSLPEFLVAINSIPPMPATFKGDMYGYVIVPCLEDHPS